MAFDALDASEVANISVLKDGASAAVYGARAANGVVLITTKKGGNAKPTINYTGTVGIDVAAMIPETLSAYEHAVYLNDRAIQGYLNNAIWNPNVEQQDPTTKSSWYTDDELAHFKTTDYSFWMMHGKLHGLRVMLSILLVEPKKYVILLVALISIM